MVVTNGVSLVIRYISQDRVSFSRYLYWVITGVRSVERKIFSIEEIGPDPIRVRRVVVVAVAIVVDIREVIRGDTINRLYPISVFNYFLLVLAMMASFNLLSDLRHPFNRAICLFIISAYGK